MWEIVTILILAGMGFYLIRNINFKTIEEVKVNQRPKEEKTEEIASDLDKKELIEEGLLEEEPDDVKGADRLISDAHTELAKGNLREAEKLLIEAIKKDRKNQHAYLALGNIFFKDGNLDDAVNAFEKTVEYDPVNDIAFNNLGLSYFKQKDYKKADRKSVV